MILSFVALFLSTGAKVANDLFEYSKNLEIFASVYKEVGDKYVDEVPPGKLMKVAITSMLASLDPYTNFFSEYQAEEALLERQGEYGGVGCKVIFRNQLPTVSDVFEGYAFDKADIHIGDVILKHNETSLKGKNQDDIMQLFRGAPNSTFQLTLKRGNVELTKTITRVSVKTKNVPYAGIIAPNIGYIKLDEFGQNCSDEIEAELKKLMASGSLKGLVLDLRDNGGGLLNEAVDIVRLFVGNKQLVVFLEGKNENGPKNWYTAGEAIAPDLPLVVLVNKHSASASEVVSGSLQDLDRAVIMGQTSFGKGLVQNYTNLPFRTQMKITTARYHTPSGRCIQKLNYSDRDESGKATIKKEEEKKSFTTKSGRKVMDAGGIDPDIFIPLFGGTPWIQWFEKEYLLFDWANSFAINNSSMFNAENWMQQDEKIFTDFQTFTLNQGPKNFETNWENHLKKQGIDSFFAQEMGLYKIDNVKVKSVLSSAIIKNKLMLLNTLKQELLKRHAKRQNFYQESLKIDFEIKECIQLLQAPERIKLILRK